MREDGIDWIIERHVRGQDHTAAIQKRHSIQNQADRARHLYLAGEIDWRSFTVARSQAEAALVGTHIPEIDDATRAGEHLGKLASEWRASSVCRRNQLLRTVLEAVYVDLDQRAVVGLLPKPDYYSALLAMAQRSDAPVRPAVAGDLTEIGGDGGGHDAQFLTWPFNVRLRHPSPSKPQNALGAAIKQGRTALGMSQTALAARLGIDRKTVRSWERGDTTPAGKKIASLGECLRVDLAGLGRGFIPG